MKVVIIHKRIAILLCVFATSITFAQTTIPTKMTFGNLKLTLKSDARKIIGDNVARLKQNKSYFQSIVARADIFFPIVEEQLKAVGVPNDIKFLCLQESELRGKAVSSSNAVGYWQFKKATGQEVGLTVNSIVDERKNIAAASRGAATYIKKNNRNLNNWVYALLSYYAGPGGVKKYVKEKYKGASSMVIDRNTHWYVLKFLSHKIAFQNEVGINKPSTSLTPFTNGGGKTLQKIAEEYKVQPSDMEAYNPWIGLNKKIPRDKTYIVIIPADSDRKDIYASKGGNKKPKLIDIVLGKIGLKDLPEIFTVNGVKSVVAKKGESSQDLAARTGVSFEKILKYNDLVAGESIKEGKHYFIQKKKTKATKEYHTTQHGETVWGISQQYGITKKSVLSKNRMNSATELKAGRVLWLQKKRPKSTPVEHKKIAPKVTPVTPTPGTGTSSLPLPKKEEALPKVEEEIEEEKKEIDLPEKVENEVEDIEALINDPSPIEIEEPTTEPEEETVEKDNDGSIEEPEVETTNTEEIVEEVTNEIPQEEIEDPLEEQIQAEAAKAEAIQVDQPKTSPAVSGKVHTIGKGETLYAISKKYGISVHDLKKLNGLHSNALSVGQQLKVEKPKPKSIKHKVKKGDTFYSISKKYGISVKDLQKLNNKSDFSLSIGEELTIQ